ncbi:unnamed protein product [Psylliodes chrysocephalus]|uniref:Uncharacterized protein n=1 Tax=Psylliodes chrysocephalus TaxID=3402493 RepID=A0A9P0C7M9_9CUCU|nr:unnamed protein product [Psylliodes chrysocephala]
MGQPKMPAIYISKYNRFVDTVIGRINTILGKSYDPVRVKLQSLDNKAKKTKKNTKGNTKNKNRNKNKKRNGQKKNNPVHMSNKMGELVIARGNQIENEPKLIESETREPAFILISKVGSQNFIKNVTVTTSEVRANPKRPSNKNKPKKKKNGTKASSTSANKNKPTKNKTKTPQATKKSKPNARATLFGLSTIRRGGDVVVNMQSDHTTVKTNFVLGPLTLRVERETGKGARRELKTATATTAEMFGRLNLKIVHGGSANLQSIRVLQPKQVRVDSLDDHDKTREYIWKRSAHIASLVSQKLTAAARSMLRQQPRL